MSEASENHRPLSPARKAWLSLSLLARPALARKLGTLITDGYLADTGWVRSVCAAAVVDASGEPLPWLAFPFVDFLGPRLKPEWRIFEYGAGASTLYFARRVKAVTAVEHDESFAAHLRRQLPSNAQLLVRPAGSESYALALAECAAAPDLVFVDGVDRAQCIQAALPRLAPNAVLVLDDAERAEYTPAIDILKSRGFRAVEFWGLAPGWVKHKCTTVFYRQDNVLGL